MSQKNFCADRGEETMRQTLVAEQIDQLDCPPTFAESGMGISMDKPVRIQRGVVVSRPVASTPRDGSEGQFVFRALGGSRPSQAQEQTKPVGILWRRGDLPRVDRSGNPSDAQRPDDSSDIVSTQASDPQAPGSVSEGTDASLSNHPETERRPPGRLYRGALFGFSSSRRHLQPKGWGDRSGGGMRGAGSDRSARIGLFYEGLASAGYSEVFADGQRHEPDRRPDASPESGAVGPILSGLSGDSGLYSRAKTRLQCSGRALQRALARESLAEVSISDIPATSETFGGLSGGLQRLPKTKIDPPRERRSLPNPCAISSEEYPFYSPFAALSWTNLVYTENR